MNIEKCVVIPDQETYDLKPPNDVLVEPEVEVPAPIRPAPNVNPELSQVAYEFGKYLSSLPNKTATASQACKQVTYITCQQGKSYLVMVNFVVLLRHAHTSKWMVNLMVAYCCP